MVVAFVLLGDPAISFCERGVLEVQEESLVGVILSLSTTKEGICGLSYIDSLEQRGV